MNLTDAYKRLGLMPLDDFIDQRASQNRKNRQPPYKGIGATTWMLVSAALKMRRGNVLLIDPSSQPPRSLLQQLKGILKGFGWDASWDNGMDIPCLKGILNHRAFCSGRRDHTFFGPVFHDNDWKEKAALRAELGPFGRIHEVRRKSAPWDVPGRDQYLAYGKDNRVLFELTWQGTQELLRENKDIQLVEMAHLGDGP